MLEIWQVSIVSDFMGGEDSVVLNLSFFIHKTERRQEVFDSLADRNQIIIVYEQNVAVVLKKVKVLKK